MEIDGDLGEASSRMAGSGWTAEEMFNINTKQFGVKTSYDSKLTEYTVALKKEQIEKNVIEKFEIFICLLFFIYFKISFSFFCRRIVLPIVSAEQIIWLVKLNHQRIIK